MLPPLRDNRQRKPSHFGSYCHSLPRGIASTERASIATREVDFRARLAGEAQVGTRLTLELSHQRKTAGFRRPFPKIFLREADQTAEVIHCCSFAFGAAPTWREAISPPLKIIRVGIDITPYFDAVFGLSSTLSFTILTLSPIAPAISSSAGAIMRQGPHHSAQKSTTTGPFALSTSASKSVSETLPTAMGVPRTVK